MKAKVVLMVLLAIACFVETVSHASIPPSISHPRPTPIKSLQQKPIVANTSCYYRVLKGQKRYMTGSYRGDIRLNGTGITRSNKVVRVGYLAADPQHHPIGTRFRVIIDGKDHGIWTVEDDGGAIKGPRRFDFCAGAGDKGLQLAQSWGLGKGHTVKMYRVAKNT